MTREKIVHKKANILKVGTVSITDEGIARLDGWSMDCLNAVPMVQITKDDGILYGGYSMTELQEISSRSSEWNTDL